MILQAGDFFCKRCKTYKSDEQLGYESPNGKTTICLACYNKKDKHVNQRVRRELSPTDGRHNNKGRDRKFKDAGGEYDKKGDTE